MPLWQLVPTSWTTEAASPSAKRVLLEDGVDRVYDGSANRDTKTHTPETHRLRLMNSCSNFQLASQGCMPHCCEFFDHAMPGHQYYLLKVKKLPCWSITEGTTIAKQQFANAYGALHGPSTVPDALVLLQLVLAAKSPAVTGN